MGAIANLWLSFFVLAFLSACWQWLVGGDSSVFGQVVAGIFAMAKLAAEIALGLIGVLCFWQGIFQVAEKAGWVAWFGRFLAPLFRHLMPGVPASHPAHGAVSMNLAANVLGLDNAATPLGLQAMRSLQSLNPTPQIASNAQILFLVLNTSSVTLLPVTIFLYRAQQGAADPTLVFIPILLATSASTLVGILMVAWFQRLPLWRPVVLAYGLAMAAVMALLLSTLGHLSAEQLSERSSLIANGLLLGVIVMVLLAGWRRQLPIYDIFIDGAKQGFATAVRLIPFLVAMLTAIGALRASGALDGFLHVLRWPLQAMGWDTRFIEALPTALMKPFSGSGARAMLLDTMAEYGVDAFPSLIAATVQGSTETTFYVLAVYFGSVGIRYGRHAVICGLTADFAGITVAILAGYLFFG